MPPQNDRVTYAFNLLFEYITYLKLENARLSSEGVSKDETIALKEAEAMEIKVMFETYVNTDTQEDSALEAIIAKAEADIATLKAG